MRKLTQTEFIDRLYNINPKIEVLDTYVNAKTKIKCKCRTDDYIWESTPDSLLSGRGCPKCGGNYRKTHNEFVTELQNINPNIIIQSKYKKDRTKLKCICLIDNHCWEATPNSLLRGKGCPKCSNHIRKDTKTFIEELRAINSDIEVIGEYEHYEKKLKCKCKIDGNIWFATPHNLLHGTGCPLCKTSKGEKRISKYLIEKCINFESQKVFDGLYGVGGKNLSYDFYLPEHNLLIEYQGNFHDGSITGSYHKNFDFERQLEHDKRKRDYAKSKGIQLLEIWYTDYNNIESILNHQLNFD